MRSKTKKVLGLAKGFRGRSKSAFTVAINRVEKALQHAYVGRKLKKRDARKAWIQQVNAGARLHGMKYHELVSGMATADIGLNRKVLADLAVTEPGSFKGVVEVVRAVKAAEAGEAAPREE